ncbi:Siderophore synthetase component [Haloechinothrix alba]|uniref:Siderophore synthetase component n=1 Tax=Haloechinothrix alba TaxID=664784 RepID=A0A238WH09_9PSEU|nr:IucA/IucC family protein [Haloechinothrix alba]SNR45855.1 Siderophore synthetase component [Haloechinothrix alba]
MTVPPSTHADAAPEGDWTGQAESAACNALLRCWVRETGLPLPDAGPVTIDLPASGTRLEAGVVYRSHAGFHRFEAVRFPSGQPVGAATLAALLVTESVAARGGGPAAVTELVARVSDSTQRIASFLASRAATAGDPGRTPFLEGEQALVLGHPLHPAPKSRLGLSESEACRISPELRGRFPLHWFAAERSVVAAEGDAHGWLAPFAPETPEGYVPVPAHPWQARELMSRPGVAGLFAGGALRDLGPYGPRWHPTASLRTVYSPGERVMLKLSLGLPITNSKRENLRVELRRGAEIDRLLDAGLDAELARHHPTFGIVRDPAWLAVDPPDGAGRPESGLEVVVRSNPFGPADRVWCVAGLLAERPDLGRAEITRVIDALAARTGTGTQDVAEEWCARYFDAVIAPVLWLYRHYGLGLEAHQQNTLVALDDDGWPCGGWYRDNQGYYISQWRAGELERLLAGAGTAGDNRCADEVIDERLGYYVGINNLLGLVGAFGSLVGCRERPLLELLRDRLRSFGDLPVATALADAASLRCKANLLTRVDGLDELVGPLETQSVYCDIPNAFAG